MRGRRALWAAHALLCLGSSSAAVAGSAQENYPPLVLITVDTLRQDRLGCYGCERNTSPHIDALAKSSVRYQYAIAQAPWTAPSVASLFTSRYPTSELGIRGVNERLPDSVPLISELLQVAGYSTAGVVANPLVTAKHGYHRGFDSFDSEATARSYCIDGTTSEMVTDRALAFLDEFASDSRPFFLWAHYMDPHALYLEHDYDLGVEFPEYDGPIVPAMPWDEYRKQRMWMSDADRIEAERLYELEIRYTDEHVGRLLDGLKAHGLFDQACICFTADHGEEFLDHGDVGHVGTLYEELVRVPLLVKFPEQTEPVVHDAPVALVDVMPTFLELADAERPERMAGVPLPRTAESSDPGRVIATEAAKTRVLTGVFQGDWKLIESSQGSVELFDLGTDPGERQNLQTEKPRRLRELTAALEAWRAEVAPHAVPRVNDPLASGQTVELSPEEIQRLLALGYTIDDIEQAREPDSSDLEAFLARFRKAWNANDRTSLEALLPEANRAERWKNIEQLFTDQGWEKAAPNLGVHRIGRQQERGATVMYRMDGGKLKIRVQRDGDTWSLIRVQAEQS